MINITSLSVARAFLACGLSAAPAQARPNRTWVSGHGTDSGACAIATPCRTFAFALTQTAAGGEIDVLNPAGYGTVTITKAINIVNDGVGVAGIRAGSGGNGVRISAGASDSVHLRGLTINGTGSGSSGILFDTGGNLAIENCVVRNFVVGINISPTTSSSFSVSNTIASHNSNFGIAVEPIFSAAVTGVLNKVTASNNVTGVAVNGSSATAGASLNVTIVDSVATNNSAFGVFAVAFSGAAATAVKLRNVVASNNGTGLFARGPAIFRVAHTVVTGNGTGVFTAFGGTIFSYVDNDIDGNANNNTRVLTPLAKH